MMIFSRFVQIQLVKLLFLFTLVGCTDDVGDQVFEKALGRAHDLTLGTGESLDMKEPIRALPLTLDFDPEIARLGESLFHDNRLSGDESLSCASCHILQDGGDDNRAVSVGIDGAVGPINSPTVLNSSFNFVQFWDGRAANLLEQVVGPVHNPIEMGSSWEQVIPRLEADSAYVEAFAELYADGITGANIGHAIVEFERSLVTPSAFDRYLRGDSHAITADAKQGYALFKSYGCVSCHQGMNVGGNMFQKFGALVSFYQDKSTTAVDDGRMAVTSNTEDKFVFKVPSLRNAARTAPYFHNASASTLSEAIGIMGQLQLGKTIPDAHIKKIEQFIVSLNGEPSRP